MFWVYLSGVYVAIYGILFFTGWGISMVICRGKRSEYALLLAPVMGILPLSILPGYLSLLGVKTAIGGWIVFGLFSAGSLYFLKTGPAVRKRITLPKAGVMLCMLAAAAPSFILILRAGFLTSTLESYSVFVTVPADYLMHHALSGNVVLDGDRPITRLLTEVMGHHEYFGFFFLLSSIAGILHMAPFTLYLALSGVVGSLAPIAAFVAAREGFGIGNRPALFIALLTSINYSYYVWPLIGQLPMIGGMVYLILALGFIPSMLRRGGWRDAMLPAAVMAGMLAMYSILIAYLLGILALYSLYFMIAQRTLLQPLSRLLKLGAATVIINPFAFVFLALHGRDLLGATSQYTKNIPRGPYIEELFGFAKHFSVTHDGSAQAGLIFLAALTALAVVCVGCYQRMFKARDPLFISIWVGMILLGAFFYGIDFTYHFYKNAIIGVFVLTVSLVIGADRLYGQIQQRSLKIFIGALGALFVLLNVHTLVDYSLADHRMINRPLMDLEAASARVPRDRRILILSYDPTQEAWISYFLRRNKIKLEGAMEPWGFWILSPFSGKPDRDFFYHPNTDAIDYTLSPKTQTGADIVSPDYGDIIYENAEHILSKKVPSPFLIGGWHHVEGNSQSVFRWTDQECSIVFANPDRDVIVHLRGAVPDVYDEPLGIFVFLNGTCIERFYAGPSKLDKFIWLPKNASNLVSIVLDQSFRPSERGASTDARRLGIRINHVGMIPEEAVRAKDRIDMGTGQSKKFLRSGWSFEETMPDGTPFAWVDGTDAALQVFVDQPEEMIMEFRAHLFLCPGALSRHTDIYVNDRSIGHVAMDPAGWRVYRMKMLSDVWKKGMNVIEFRFPSCGIPAEVLENSSDRRCLSAAFDYVKFFKTTPDVSEP